MSPQALRTPVAHRLLVGEAREEQALKASAPGIGRQPGPEPPRTDGFFAPLLNRPCYEIMQAARAGTRGDELVRCTYAEAIESCRPLLRQAIAEGHARGLKDPELRSWTYVMMTPFTQGREWPTDGEWEKVRAGERWKAPRACRGVEMAWMMAKASERRLIVAWINEQAIGAKDDLPLWRLPDRNASGNRDRHQRALQKMNIDEHP
jgi:hypothetical protein